MTVNPLPPQAYTKETLQKAYTWLLNQSPSVKDMATSQDMLISLYLKAQRSGDASLETPSIQNFKQELKNLASIMGDLQTQTPPSLQSKPAAVASPVYSQTAVAASPQLDAASLQAIADVRTTLNLSSDTEALRALISLGHRQFRKI